MATARLAAPSTEATRALVEAGAARVRAATSRACAVIVQREIRSRVDDSPLMDDLAAAAAVFACLRSGCPDRDGAPLCGRADGCPNRVPGPNER